MSFEGGTDSTLSADDAFAALAHEVRLDALQVLARSDGPMPFGELRECVGVRDPGRFNYHLDALRDHFVARTDEGYVLRQAGRRVVEAVLSGAVNETPIVDRTPIETPCFVCDAPMEISYRGEQVVVYCTECGGTRTAETVRTAETGGVVGKLVLPPAGVRDRSATELFLAAEAWSVPDFHRVARGVCPRCSAPLNHTTTACRDHDASAGLCPRCDRRFDSLVGVTCATCVYEERIPLRSYLIGEPSLMGFMIDHGVDPIVPEGFQFRTVEENVVSVEPFEARFTYRIDGDALTLTVDGTPSVVDAARR